MPTGEMFDSPIVASVRAEKAHKAVEPCTVLLRDEHENRLVMHGIKHYDKYISTEETDLTSKPTFLR